MNNPNPSLISFTIADDDSSRLTHTYIIMFFYGIGHSRRLVCVVSHPDPDDPSYFIQSSRSIQEEEKVKKGGGLRALSCYLHKNANSSSS